MITLTDTEIDEINQLIHDQYHVDFRNYAKSSLSRRFTRITTINALKTKDDLIGYINNISNINQFIEEITVNTTEMFRDPTFWLALRNVVLPELNTHENIRIWHAGCSTGEEVVSMQILLRELGMEHKVTAYATDIDLAVIEKAKQSIYSSKNLSLNEANYKSAGGLKTLSYYFQQPNDFTYAFNLELLNTVTFKKFDLVKDTMYNKFDLILCRNVLIYFDFNLQENVIEKFISTLFSQGFIAIGQKETILSNTNLRRLNVFDGAEKIYRYNK